VLKEGSDSFAVLAQEGGQRRWGLWSSPKEVGVVSAECCVSRATKDGVLLVFDLSIRATAELAGALFAGQRKVPASLNPEPVSACAEACECESGGQAFLVEVLGDCVVAGRDAASDLVYVCRELDACCLTGQAGEVPAL
jgi:hypothetical protein